MGEAGFVVLRYADPGQVDVLYALTMPLAPDLVNGIGVAAMSCESSAPQFELCLTRIVLFVCNMEASRSFYDSSLGLRVIAVKPPAVIYSAGPIQICLLPAAGHALRPVDGKDRSAAITLLVTNFSLSRNALTARGVRFSRTIESAIGITADFYDPDGHCFSLYQPYDAASQSPSPQRLEALAIDQAVARSSGIPSADADCLDGGLADAVIADIALFFRDPGAAEAFYTNVLGLPTIEDRSIRRCISPSVSSGIMHYDIGTTMLTTRYVETEGNEQKLASVGASGFALLFRVVHLSMAVAALSRRGISFSAGLLEDSKGRVARFVDPAGNILLLREPTAEDDYDACAGTYGELTAKCCFS